LLREKIETLREERDVGLLYGEGGKKEWRSIILHSTEEKALLPLFKKRKKRGGGQAVIRRSCPPTGREGEEVDRGQCDGVPIHLLGRQKEENAAMAKESVCCSEKAYRIKVFYRRKENKIFSVMRSIVTPRRRMRREWKRRHM